MNTKLWNKVLNDCQKLEESHKSHEVVSEIYKLIDKH